jgi:hypothetical protein
LNTLLSDTFFRHSYEKKGACDYGRHPRFVFYFKFSQYFSTIRKGKDDSDAFAVFIPISN